MADAKNAAAVALGRMTSERKAQAARSNGRRGGPYPSVTKDVRDGLETLTRVYGLTHERLRLSLDQREAVVKARAWINRLRVREEA